MPGLFGIGLMTFEIVQRGLDLVARLLARTNDMDGMTDRVHGLFEHEDFVFFAELTDQHQNLFTRHLNLSLLT